MVFRKRKAASSTKSAQTEQQEEVDGKKLTVQKGATSNSNDVCEDPQPPAKKAKGNVVEELPLKEEAEKPSPVSNEKKICAPKHESGTLVFCGGTSWDLIGRRQVPKSAAGAKDKPVNLYGPHCLTALNKVRVGLAVSSSVACHSIIVTENGLAMSWGRNNKSQLGLGDTKRRDVPTLIEGVKDLCVVDAAVGRSHTLLLTDQGEVFSFGDNSVGQCGVGQRKCFTNVPKKVLYQGPLITKVACGAEFSFILDSEGYLYSFGSPEYGQLGNNTDGKYFVTASKLTYDYVLAPKRITMYLDKSSKVEGVPVYDVCITSVACGINHTIAIDSEKRCYTWGHGGFGRLGHAETKDEMVPRLVKFFDGPQKGARSVHAGGSYTLVINEHGALFFWGQRHSNNESTMYPKPVLDLGGWKVSVAACGSHSIVVFADNSVVSWGTTLYGELGYGDKGPKSSARPKVVEALESCHVHSVSCGYGHTLFVIRDTSAADRSSLGKLPTFSPESC